VTIGVVLHENLDGENKQQEIEIENMVEQYQADTECDMQNKPRVVKLRVNGSDDRVGARGISLRMVLQRSLEEGYNAAAIVAKSMDEVEEWAKDGHCQNLILEVKAAENGVSASASAEPDGVELSSLQNTPFAWVKPRFRQINQSLRDICSSETCDVQRRHGETVNRALELKGIKVHHSKQGTNEHPRLAYSASTPGTLLIGSYTWLC